MEIVGRFLNRGEVPATEVAEAYVKAFKVRWWHRFFGQGDIQLADQTYKEADLDKINEILAKDKTEKESYSAEDFDCDDFAFRLMGAFHRDRETAAMPIFITWVTGHALLSFYHDGNISMIEPQTDEIFPVPEKWSLILLCG